MTEAELAALRASIKAEVLAEVREMISLRQVTEQGHPNLNALAFALRNVTAANLSLKFFGYELGRKLASALPPPTKREPMRIELESKLSTQADIESAWLAGWAAELHLPILYHRKLWELAYVLQALWQHDLLRPGTRGLGFGCGEEPIASYLASRGVNVTVTDLDTERATAAGWVHTGQHAASLDKAFVPELVDRAMFDRHVDFAVADMNAIPEGLRGGYDFCWSVCSLEHLGSIEKGLTFIERSLDTLRPGGIAVHTTEYNIDPGGPTVDNWPTVLFQRGHLDALAERLASQGHEVARFNFDLGDGPMDRFIDVPPWIYDAPEDRQPWFGEPQVLKLALDGFIATCVGLVIRKGG